MGLDVLMGAAAEVAIDNDRLVDMERPSRGAHSSVVRASSRVRDAWAPFAACVLRRESGASMTNLQSREDARNATSSAAGRFQFLDAWRRGGSFMVRDRLVRFGMPKQQARVVRVYLGARPIYEWDGFWQNILFNEVIDRGGWAHWRNGDRCDSLVPAGAR